MTTYIADQRFFATVNTIAARIDANQPPCPFVVDRIVEALVESGIYPSSIAVAMMVESAN